MGTKEKGRERWTEMYIVRERLRERETNMRINIKEERDEMNK